MKRLLTIMAILCLLTGCFGAARAEIEITEQPETQTVKAGGTVTFSVEAKDVGKSAITWHFISPDGQEDVTGRKQKPSSLLLAPIPAIAILPKEFM